MSTLAIAKRTITDIARDANREYELVETLAHNIVGHAIKCAHHLEEAKERVEHGFFEAWVAENFHGGLRTAQVYMQLAKAQSSAPIEFPSIAQGLKYIVAAKREKATGGTRQVTNLMRALNDGDQGEQIIDAVVVEDDIDPVVAKLIATLEHTLEEFRGSLALNPEAGKQVRTKAAREARDRLRLFIESPA